MLGEGWKGGRGGCNLDSQRPTTKKTGTEIRRRKNRKKRNKKIKIDQGERKFKIKSANDGFNQEKLRKGKEKKKEEEKRKKKEMKKKNKEEERNKK